MIDLVTRIQRALVALVPLLVIACLPAATACSAMPSKGPSAVRIDPAFTPEQRDAIEAAVYEWDEDAQLTIAVSSWDDKSAIKIERDDSVANACRLGVTTWQTTDKSARMIRLVGAGIICPNGKDALGNPANMGDASEYDFESVAVHELGHLMGLSSGGCDGYGHSDDERDAMYMHGDRSGARHLPSQNDVERVRRAVEENW